MLDQGLSVRHQHRLGTDGDRIAHDLYQLVGAPCFPVGIGDIAACDLQSAIRTLKASIGVDLLFDLGERRDWN